MGVDGDSSDVSPATPADEPSFLGNLLFLVGSFFASGLVTAAVTDAVRSWTGLDGVPLAVGSGLVFLTAFGGCLLFYDHYYLDG